MFRPICWSSVVTNALSTTGWKNHHYGIYWHIERTTYCKIGTTKRAASIRQHLGISADGQRSKHVGLWDVETFWCEGDLKVLKKYIFLSMLLHQWHILIYKLCSLGFPEIQLADRVHIHSAGVTWQVKDCNRIRTFIKLWLGRMCSLHSVTHVSHCYQRSSSKFG